ncbi:MAG: GDSL-type esterase/lipase family protein, partial [Hymenobacteraceae bacterium]|nr:GDSL-type esterase/lipase family protein [Hymenobacteraceae bacterium]MDX5397596.1 GDSL-type esterase/lipase family protein [Hymenobacteraceae bacterium]MDX5513676.1 GDSL-type esterase/lipase family protein [Hymenobacteraceae bacterium]
ILYHSIGVNGAEYRHYNRSEYFFEQVKLLKPDLVVVSLGTNDAYHSGFDSVRFSNELDLLVSRIRSGNPEANILLTTPPDSYRNRKYRNADMKKLRDTLVQYCYDHNLACWDFYSIMGGYGSILKWVQAGLAQNDRVHLTARGYDVQGLLLYSALRDGFEKFAAARSE